MKKWIYNYNLEMMTVILALVVGGSFFFWDSMTIAGKALLALLGFVIMEQVRFQEQYFNSEVRM